MGANSNLAKTMEALRAAGCIVDKCEQWIPRANIRRDLFHLFDIIAIHPDRIVGVQVCTMSDRNAHLKKMCEDNRTACEAWLRAGGGIEVWAWRPLLIKLKDGTTGARKVWKPMIQQITLNEFDRFDFPMLPDDSYGISVA